MNKSIKVALSIFFTFLYSHLFSQPPVMKITPDKRYMPQEWENYIKSIPVSGEIRVGAMAFESSDRIRPMSFFVKIPKHIQPILCVEISSRDGRYQARLPFTITDFEPGVYELDLPTRYKDELKNYTIKDITILAKVAKTCDEDAECYVLSAWNTPTFNNIEAYIYLNSDQYTELILTKPLSTSIDHVIKCEKILETIATAYNCLCKVSYYDLNKFSNIQIRRIINRGSRRSYNYIKFPIRL